jgi:hypothetical protein
MSDRYVDLDAFFDEQDEKPVIVKVLGEEWHLPPSPPADAMLRAQRLMLVAAEARSRLRDLPEDAEVPEDLREALSFDMDRHARALIGSENLDAMLAKGLKHNRLMKLLQKVMEIHQGPSPNRAARREGGHSE